MTNLIGPDVDFYNDDDATPRQVDFYKTAGVSKFVLIRAGQNVWIDPDLIYNWRESKKAGLARGSYWFYDSRVDPASQAEKWIEALGWDLGELPLFADFEEKYGGPFAGWENWKIFLERIKELIAGHELGIYTRAEYFNLNVPTAEREYFKQFSLWIAHYGVTVPTIPDTWSTWLFWQSTDLGNGPAYGAESAHIDLNYFNGDLAKFFDRFDLSGVVVPPPPVKDEIWQTHTGVTLYKIRRFDTDCFITVIDLAQVDIKLATPFSTIPDAVRNNKAELGFNGGGWGLWPDKSLANEYLIIEGKVIQTKSFDGRPCIEITKDDKIIFHETQPSFTKSWNVWGFDRLIATNGIFNSRISDKISTAPRTCYGVDIYGHLVVLVCEGRQGDQKGLTFPEIWEVMKAFNVTDCGNADGGYSSAIVNTAFDPQLLNSTYSQEIPNRRTVYQVLFFAAGENPQGPPDVPPTIPPGDTTMKTYKVVVPVKARKTPSMFQIDTIGNLTIGTHIDSDAREMVTEKIEGIDHTIIWVKLPAIYQNYWAPMIYKGVTYIEEVLQDPTPPPAGPKKTAEIEVFDDGTVKVNNGPF